MSRNNFTFVAEPVDANYTNLIRSIGACCTHALLVIRDDLGLDESGRKILERLKRSQVSEKRAASWPGTSLLGHEATIVTFGLNAEVTAVLSDAVAGLFEWTQPSRPEDLCLMRNDQTAALTTISHEKDAYLELDSEEYRVISKGWPGLKSLVRQE